MIIYLCIKYDSNTLVFSKDIERKPFSYGKYGCTDMILYGWGIITRVDSVPCAQELELGL